MVLSDLKPGVTPTSVVVSVNIFLSVSLVFVCEFTFGQLSVVELSCELSHNNTEYGKSTTMSHC